MKAIILLVAAALFFTGCNKTAEAIFDKTTSPDASAQFVKYTIQKGNQYCNGNAYRAIETTEMKFVAKFDSTAIYETQSEENQYDINKLYGFSDNNADHHQYSARFGWRWSGGTLRLFAYIYNNSVVTSKELTTVNIGAEINCSIKVTSTSYLFTVNGVTTQLPRMATTEKAKGYQLYPYFGGDEAAPHQITIWIKDVDAAN
jgi:hypothetical protein